MESICLVGMARLGLALLRNVPPRLLRPPSKAVRLCNSLASVNSTSVEDPCEYKRSACGSRCCSQKEDGKGSNLCGDCGKSKGLPPPSALSLCPLRPSKQSSHPGDTREIAHKFSRHAFSKCHHWSHWAALLEPPCRSRHPPPAVRKAPHWHCQSMQVRGLVAGLMDSCYMAAPFLRAALLSGSVGVGHGSSQGRAQQHLG